MSYWFDSIFHDKCVSLYFYHSFSYCKMCPFYYMCFFLKFCILYLLSFTVAKFLVCFHFNCEFTVSGLFLWNFSPGLERGCVPLQRINVFHTTCVSILLHAVYFVLFVSLYLSLAMHIIIRFLLDQPKFISRLWFPEPQA